MSTKQPKTKKPQVKAPRLPPSSLTDERYLPHPDQRRQKLFTYDVSTYDFQQLIYEILLCTKGGCGMPSGRTGSGIGAELFTHFHEFELVRGPNLNHNARRTAEHKTYKRIATHPGQTSGEELKLHERLTATLKLFARNVLAPLLGCGPDDVIYQRAPTLRISVPCEIPMGHPHNDYSYHHQVLSLRCAYLYVFFLSFTFILSCDAHVLIITLATLVTLIIINDSPVK